jgi:pyrroline-5-carboxylate reductase
LSFPPIAFLGAGQMAEALIRGVLRADLVEPRELMATARRPGRLDFLGRELSIKTSLDNREAVTFGRVVVLAVKPQDVPGLLGQVGPLIGPEQILVSVAAGVPIARIERELSGPAPVVRVMPNTPSLIGAGVAALSLGSHASKEDGELVGRLMGAVGRAVVLSEGQLDAVTALSASGPAFVAIFIEALIDAGVRVGLPRDVSTVLTLQTVLGTARMIEETGRHPVQMKEMVTSPGGTTMAGIQALERGGLRGSVIDAIVAATERSKELGRGQ